MEIIPAIDLRQGKCVRLVEGRADRQTVYAGDPAGMARQWEAQGARRLHVVDLDGAFTGRPGNLEAVRAICSAVEVPAEVGGGVRSAQDIQRVLDAGARWVILGTRACADRAFLREALKQWGERILVGVDARAGKVAVRGWAQVTDVEAATLAAEVCQLGVATLVYTDTARDGTLQGPNTAEIARVCAAVRCDVIASGGVAGPDDVARLVSLGRPNLVGVIVGKALYDGVTTLADLLRAASVDPR